MVNATVPASLQMPQFVFGVDYSGAAQAGRNAWLATMRPTGTRTAPGRLQLTGLTSLGDAAGSTERDRVNEFLVQSIRDSRAALWGMDYPFGLPIELGLGDWPDQLRHVREFNGTAKDYGRALVELARSGAGRLHVRRATDLETKTPFDCYHYRIIYQTFHGMRDVLARVAEDERTAVVPFQMPKVAAADRCVVEACPSSTLKRLGLPHQRYKQTANRPPEDFHVQTRRTILKTISELVEFTPHRRRVMMANPGGDAIDAVLAGLGAWQAWQRETWPGLNDHPRYPREGKVFC